MISVRHAAGSVFITVLASVLLAHCAGQIQPPGGPVDSIPPVVMRTDPDSGATRVDELRVEIEFSEYVDRRSVEESIFISPPVAISEFDWSGTEVTIYSDDTLRDNTTYVVSLGTDVVDVRAANRMASGFTLAFSTGDSLDRGSIAGKVYDKAPAGVTIFAYLLTGLDADTVNPSFLKPHYVMQTGDRGDYRISNLAYGEYRVVAVRDQYKNFLYDRQMDQYGVWRAAIRLSSETPEAEGISFRLTIEDTTAPFLSGVQALNADRILFHFSEPIDSASFQRSAFMIEDTVTGAALDPLLLYLDPETSSSGGIVTALPLDPAATYRLTVLGVADTTGRLIDSANASLLFAGSGTPDTVAPMHRFLSFADTTMGYPLSRPLIVGFSEPVLQSPFEDGFRMTGPEEEPVPLSFTWLSPVRVAAVADRPLKPAAVYLVAVVLDSLQDLSGNAIRDSVVEVRFASFNPLSSGEIGGRVKCTDCPDGSRLYVTARNIPDGWEWRTDADSSGAFHLKELAPGKYTISVFRDDDRSENYSYGLPFPFSPSEPFVVGRDTVRVRARWGIEGMVIRFP